MMPVWHDGPLGTLAWGGAAPVVWRVPVSAGDREQARSLRRRCACALVATLAALPVDRVRLGRSPAGAPVVASPAGWYLGLSSRGSHALIGVATRPIAVDREPVDSQPPLWDMLTPAEADAVRALPRAAQPLAWLRRWTIKEAHAKLVGEPRRIAPEAIHTTVEDDARAIASFEGVSAAWTRLADGAIETAVQWADAAR